jgi:uncharacterized glyoxalase superfamily protein PhnB
MHVSVRLSDIDSEHARLSALGVAVSELRSQPWGERSFNFKDPDGYEWSYGDVKEAPHS